MKRSHGIFGVIAVGIMVGGGLLFSGFFNKSYETLDDSLSPYDTLGEKVEADLQAYPLVSLSEEYTITDTLKDGVDISFGGSGEAAGSDTTSQIARSRESVSQTDSPSPVSTPDQGIPDPAATTPNTTFTSPGLKETLSLTFPQDLTEPLVVTLPGEKVIAITHNVEEEYTSELLTKGTSPAAIPTPADSTWASAPERALEEEIAAGLKEDNTETPQYLKYTSADSRIHTYYAYQKDQAAGYRNLKHWTIFDSGSGEEFQSYTFENARLKLNDRGEVEVRYFSQQDQQNQEVKDQVDGDLWARAQSVLQQDLEADLENQSADLIIPAPYTIDAQGNLATHEWEVSEDRVTLSVSFQVPLLGYPIALDPTLQFTAPGTSNSGTVLTGEASSYFGASLATGDFNSDGTDDLAVGTYNYDIGSNTNEGRTYIFYGGSLGASLTAAGNADVTLTGETSSYFGYSLSTGDFNHDGTDDLAVGAYTYSSNTGRTYLFYGGSLGVSLTAASDADVTITGEASSYFGFSLQTGDFNADGTDDLAVGAYGYSGWAGRVYLFYGGSLGASLTAASDANVTITGEAGSAFGFSLQTGDFNADGTDDLAVGAYYYPSFGGTGRAYIFYGGSLGASLTAAGNADVTISGEASSYFGHSLTTGDFNHDGTDDLVVGAVVYSSWAGRTYIFYGGSLGASLTAASDADVTITGEASSYFAFSLQTGDFNHDGTDDLAVGAYGYGNTGRTYIFYGGSLGASLTAASNADVTITGEAGSAFGSSLTTGDLNSDGTDDLVVGASGYNSNTGRAYIFYSQSGQVNLDQTITGEGAGDYFGSAFAVGDFNNDGREDLAVGAYKDNTNTGKVYIFYNDGDYTTLASTSDVTITGEASSYFGGYSLTSGDLNSDGTDDLVVGASGYTTNTGRTYIFYGGSLGASLTAASDADVTITGEASSHFGIEFETGDYNSDGTDDLVVGASTYGPNHGRAYIFYGGSLGASLTAGIDDDVTISASYGGGYFGRALSTGDYNSDGTDDLAVGEPGYSSYTGRTYVFYNDGSMATSTGSADVTLAGESVSSFGIEIETGDYNSDGKDDLAVGGNSADRVYLFYNDGSMPAGAETADVTITTGQSNTNFGDSLTTGDFNHDGTDDLAVGAYGYSSFTGRAYIFYGGTFTASMEAATSSSVMITGDSESDVFGYALAAGDFNNDGKDDLVIGAPGYDNGADTGRIYFNETKENYAWDIQRQSLSDGVRVDPLMGYELKITGEPTDGKFGTAMAMADLNNDGKEDLIVGASEYNSNQGRVYIFYNNGDYPTKAGRADVVIDGEAANNLFGISLTTGDFDNDGKDDLVVGAYGGYLTYTGRAYIFYNDGSIPTAAANADVTLTGETTLNYFGHSFTTGDYNADGKEDLAVGAWGYTNNTGRTYIFYGGALGPSLTAGADDDVTITGENSSQYYFSRYSTTGDFNHDGIDDIAVSAYGHNTFTGRTYIFYGGSLGASLTAASNADVTITGEQYSTFGASLATGDFNADGTDDLAVGAIGYSTATGRAYIFYGGTLGSTLTAGTDEDVTITGEATNNSFGTSLTTGDFNHDGIDDLAVGASYYDVGAGTNEGRAYLFYSTSTPGSRNASAADVTLTGEATDNDFGWSVHAGDLNNDGTTDLLVGAIGYNSNQGRLYFYTTNDRVITGVNSSGLFGRSFATGDFNNDGKNDLAVGEFGYNSLTGRTHIFYGGSKAATSTAEADVTLTGESTNSYFGSEMVAGDIDDDGDDDLIVGAHDYSSNGRVYIFYNDGAYPSTAASADVKIDGEFLGRKFGTALAIGDLNQDGKDDLIVSDPQYSATYTGRVYIFYNDGAIPTAAGSAEVKIDGSSYSYSGGDLVTGDWNDDSWGDLAVSSLSSVTIYYGDGSIPMTSSTADVAITGTGEGLDPRNGMTTGDFNHDGADDIALSNIAAYSNKGQVYVFYGGNLSSTYYTAADITLTGETTNSDFGRGVVTGDFNADGTDDLAIGADYYNSLQGRAYIFYGDELRDISAEHANIIVTGEATNNNFGYALLTADLSGNGVDDLVIGGWGYDDTSNEGRVYILTSEAAAEHFAQYRLRGTVKMQGSVKFR